MAIKIKELIIKAICGDNTPQPENKKQETIAPDQSGLKLSYLQRKSIIDECTSEVLDRIKRMNDY
ncbi:DUF5908 family protein [Mongoliibacter ruber]|uniref:Uncharacterized protein n=1 Tax=Mongoliibacter ruber TaxID=1750599 RepID=A0A2T0WPI6_9BACT|nr:DUF5908 family protein [Mongoliibacter ruber]PRY88609.1 hypothetical protein CLW00_104260 [Mongoliibacter ruber]